MKKLSLLSLLLFFWGGCKTSPISLIPTFETFHIQKINEKGIQDVEISAARQEWPEVKYNSVVSNNFESKNLKIAIIGDTGCRLKEAKDKHAYQKCHLGSEWPYPEIIKKVVSENYDFAIHTGDYHYREQCSDPKLCPVYTSSLGYGWAAWWDDFYGPSQVLFKKSPLLFVRGNHEDCHRAFSGWGALSALNKKFSDTCDEIEPYQWIEMQDLVLINFDDSGLEDKQEISAADVEKWVKVFAGLVDKIKSLNGKKEIWFLAHKPILGYVPNQEDAEPFAIKENVKSILKKADVLDKIDFFLSGHIHNQQIVIAEKDMTQVIVGHTGTGLDPFGRKIMNSKMISTTETKYSFGYALFKRTGFKKWTWLFKNVNGKIDLTCKVNQHRVQCED